MLEKTVPSGCILGRDGPRLAGGLHCLEPLPRSSTELLRPLSFGHYSFLSQLFFLRITMSQYSVCGGQTLLSGSSEAQSWTSWGWKRMGLPSSWYPFLSLEPLFCGVLQSLQNRCRVQHSRCAGCERRCQRRGSQSFLFLKHMQPQPTHHPTALHTHTLASVDNLSVSFQTSFEKPRHGFVSNEVPSPYLQSFLKFLLA